MKRRQALKTLLASTGAILCPTLAAGSNKALKSTVASSLPPLSPGAMLSWAEGTEYELGDTVQDQWGRKFKVEAHSNCPFTMAMS